MQVIVVAGTSTGVGKTFVTVALARELRRLGLSVRARKPVESFAPGQRTDAQLLASATGETPLEVCPPAWSYPLEMAPPMAAAVLGRQAPSIAELGKLVLGTPSCDVVLVEGAGGVRSPLGTDGDLLALIAAISPARVVLVADAGLGVINTVRLSVDALGGTPVVLLNRFDGSAELHRRNLDHLVGLGLEIVTEIDVLAQAVLGP